MEQETWDIDMYTFIHNFHLSYKLISQTPLTLTFTVHLYRYFEAPEATLEEPGKSQTNQDVKHIAPHCIGHCHIAKTCWWNQKHFLTTGPTHISLIILIWCLIQNILITKLKHVNIYFLRVICTEPQANNCMYINII